MTAGAVASGHVGAVLDGAVRDLVEIRRDYGFPVCALDVSPGTTLGRYKTVASQVAVRVGGIIVRPGDIVVGDVDGVPSCRAPAPRRCCRWPKRSTRANWSRRS